MAGDSLFDILRDSILSAVRAAGGGEWNVFVGDEASLRLMRNVLKDDDVLDKRVTNIEQLEMRRRPQRDMDVIYFLTPEPHIVDCVLADMEQRRYRKASLLWTSLLHSSLRQKIDKSRAAQEQIRQFRVLDVGYFPRESNVVTLRDPWSFLILYHPACNNLVRQHIEYLSRSIVSVCVSLGEYPTIRYYRPRSASHEAAVLSSHIARFVQEEIDMYAQFHTDFPAPSTRPRGTLYILDRSLDLIAPLVHEFTYQAMIHDLLPIREGEKVTYKVTVNEGRPDQEVKHVELTEKDTLWIANRHRHMKDTIDRLMGDFQKFLDQHPHFSKADQNSATSLHAIKDMMAGLPQFQEMKEAYSLHLTMAQDCMNIFQKKKLPDLASVEQSLATGLDEDYRKPKNLADQVVRSLDEETIEQPDRLRLLLLYILYQNGLVPVDITRLLSHAQLSPDDGEIIRNLTLLGAKTTRSLKEPKTTSQPLFPRASNRTQQEDYSSLSRFQPALKSLLLEHHRGTLDQEIFPYTKPQLEPQDGMNDTPQASLRTGKATWARPKGVASQPRQRVIVFMAGGATYSESRACYEASQETDRDVYLVTSHMLSPNLFVRQLSDLSVERRRLGIPADLPKMQAPRHLFEPEPEARPKPAGPTPPQQQQQQQQVPTAQMANMRLGADQGRPPTNGTKSSTSQTRYPPAERPKESDKKLRNFFKK